MKNVQYNTKKIRRQISRKAETQSYRVCKMTANAFEEDKRDAVAAGMNGHIAKPIQADNMLSILAEIIRQQEKKMS